MSSLPSMLTFAAKKRLHLSGLRLFGDSQSKSCLKNYDSAAHKLLRLSRSSCFFHTSSSDGSNSGDGKDPPPDVPISTIAKSDQEDKGLDVKVT